MTTPLTALHVIGVRYHNSELDVGDARSLDAYLQHDVYTAAGVPHTYVEPRINDTERTDDEPANLGLIGGAIAAEVAAGRRAGAAILMTGGNCCHITGVVGGLQAAHGVDARIGLVWFDAHGDFNTPKTTRSGMLGGMPVAVAAGLALPQWRIASGIVAPLPTERILMVDVRNLDPAEEQLIRATDVQIARVALGFKGDLDLAEAVAALAAQVDVIYFHIDSDILDLSLVPNHGTGEPDGPDMTQVCAAIDTVMATGKVGAYAVVSVYGQATEGTQHAASVSIASGIALIRHGIVAWRAAGMAAGR